MPEVTTLGKHLVNSALPPQYRDNERTLGGTELDTLLSAVGHDNPELYRDISHKLMNLGKEHTFTEGVTLKLSDTFSPIDRKQLFKDITKQERQIKHADISDEERQTALSDLYSKTQELINTSTYDEGLKKNNLFARQVEARARGSKDQLAGLLSSPSAFKDATGRIIPMYPKRSYAEGLKPWEWYASTFGGRQGAVAVKRATPQGGDLGKQLTAAAMGLIVTSNDCGTTNGAAFDIDDPDNDGALLAKNIEGFPAGTPYTSKVKNVLKKKGYDKIILRSPMTCTCSEGLCKHCVGLRENGKLPNLRDNIGVVAGSALAERVAQSALNTKHSGRGKGTEHAGFPVINQLVQVPEAFAYKAPLASSDGAVSRIEPAPQGGFNIFIDDQPHYAEADSELHVKVGDKVEAGDQLASGIVNPAEIVQYKGVGAGRKYLTERLTKAFRDSKLSVNRRNVEVISRAIINRVDVDDPEGLGDYLPGDSVSYDALAYSYKPRTDAKIVKPREALGKYLEQPMLHYSIGTKLTGKMADELEHMGMDNVMVHDVAPGFTPVMERLRGSPAVTGKDWMAKLTGSNLKANLLKDIHYGSESNIHGTHPMPGLAYGAEFGQSKPGKVTY